MANFAYYNVKHTSINYTIFELTCNYYFQVFDKNSLNLHFKSKFANELTFKL